MKDKNNNLDDISEQYLEEMESNNKIFEQKIQNLNELIIRQSPKKIKEEKQNEDTINKENSSSKKRKNRTRSHNEIQKNLYKINLNEFNEEIDIKNYSFKKNKNEFSNYKNNEYDTSFDYLHKKSKKNIMSETKFNHSNKYSNQNDYLIENIKNLIVSKDKKRNNNHIKCNKCNALLLEIEDKKIKIDNLENKIKYLKLKIDNIIIDNKKLEKENENLNNKLSEVISKVDNYKIDSSKYLQKLDDLKLENKRINIEYLNLNNEYNKIKEENEKLKSNVGELHILIYNYQKHLNLKTFNLDKERYNQDRYNIANNDNLYNKKAHNLSDFAHINYKYNNEDNRNNIFYKKRDEMKYNNYDDSKGNKYNYYKTNYNNDSLMNINERDKKIRKGELNYLENYLNSLLKDRIRLENELNEIDDNPQTLSNIKSRNNIKDKILQNNNEILIIKKKLQKLRGY